MNVLRLLRHALIVLTAVAALPTVAFAASGDLTQIVGLRFGIDGTRTRIVLEADRRFDYDVRTVEEPARLVIGIPDVVWNPQPGPLSRPRGLTRDYRYTKARPDRGEVLVDIKEPFRVTHTEFLTPSKASAAHRLVIELAATQVAASDAEDWPPVPQPRPGTVLGPTPPAASVADALASRPGPGRRPVIVIDAGHGGGDPGATGVNGVEEKTITLAMAKALARALDATGRYDAVLTRDSDEYVPLRERIHRARVAQGSLFVSLHADAIGSHATRGASVYTLSEKASDAEAAKLAAKENKADIINGADLGDHDALVTSILIDLAQRDAKNKSVEFADVLGEEFATVSPLLRKHRRFAGFAVLKAPDLPSVLIELGYLSNPTDARNLADRTYRARLARATVQAIDRYFASLRS